jgi:flagellar biosynthesis protein FlhB
MAEAGAQEKTERATGKKRQEARKKGQVAKSREVNSVCVLLAALLGFFFSAEWMANTMMSLIKGHLQNMGTASLGMASCRALMLEGVTVTLWLLSPLLLAVVIAGVGANIAQVGFLVVEEPFKFNFSKLDPIKGMKRLFSLRSLVEVFKSLLKILFIGGITYLVLKNQLQDLPGLVHFSVQQLFVFTGRTLARLFLYVCLGLIALAALDYVYQKWQYERDLRMSKEEIKEENKQREGDPKIKSRIRSMQMSIARQRMMGMVPEATVVITNPTHLAVALKFDAKIMSAPQVIAKGSGHIAEKIKSVAAKNGIPIVEDKPLARVLMKSVEIGAFIPSELYRAVAEVLAYVYRLKGLVRT